MSDYLKFTIIGEDGFTPAFDKLKGHMPSLRTAATAAATGLAALGASLFAITKTTANAYDEINDLSNRLGISTEALSKYKYAASLSGVEMETLTRTFQTLTAGVQEATKGSGTAYEALTRLGVSIKEIKDQTPDKQFEAIGDKLSKVSSASEKTALAMQLFGARGTSVLQMLDQGTAGLEKMKNEAEKLGLVISQDTADKADEFNDSLTRLQGALTGMKNGIGVELMPQITAFTEYMVNNLDPILKTVSGTFKTLLTIFYGLKVVVESVVTVWITEFTSLKDVVSAVFKAIAAASHGDFAGAWDAIKTGFADVKTDIKIGGEQIVDDIKNTVDKIKGLWSDSEVSAPKIKGSGAGAVAGISNAVKAMVGSAEDVQTVSDEISPVIDQNNKEQNKKQQDALDALHKLRLESCESDINQLDAWYNEQYKMFEDNKDALAELDEIYGEKSDELMEEKLEKEQELFDALQSIHDEYFLSEEAKLDLWYANEQIKYQGNQEALLKLDQVYKAKKQALDKADRAKSLVIASEFFGNMSAIAAAFGKKGAGIAKSFAIAETIVNTYKAATGAYSAMASIPYIGPALGIAAAAAAIAAGLANVQKIRSSKIEGIAHGGLTSVPKESTYLLDKGERVLSPNQNRDLTRALQGGMGGTLNQTNHFHILENATGADVLFSMSASKWKDLTYEKIVPALKQAQAAGVY